MSALPSETGTADAAYVEASLRYLRDTGEKPANYITRPGAEVTRRTGANDFQTMRILDGRARARDFDIDREGFTFLRHRYADTDYFDTQDVEKTQYPEAIALVQKALGATRVQVFDHTLRTGNDALRTEKAIREPVRFVHNDYTEKSGPQRVHDLIPDEADELLRHRFAFVNVWHPIRRPVVASPLAICDAQSIAYEDLLANDLVYEDRVGEIYAFTHNPEHRWYYFPEMAPDETILIKCYDSETDGRARFTAHTAFDDPSTPEGAPPRESIELRTIAFFGLDA